MSITDEIKQRLDIVDIVSETVQLRKSGRSYTGFCPFHQNTRTPAFVVFPDSQTWRCFGACAEGGDLFSYVMKRQGWDFKETLEHLAARAGVQLEELTPAQQKKRDARDRLADLLNAAADYFHHLLLHAPQAAHARRYIEERGLEEGAVEAFRLGYSLDSWDACRTHFNDQGYSDDDLVAAGLLTENPERNTRYDRFRNRLMFPIRDASGTVVGFGARTLDPDGVPKYLNSPQTDLFDKSALLYGLDMAKWHIREARQAVIVEGYMDVIQGWQMGFRNMVAQMGTALTETQLNLLKRYTKRFVIALDADAAGFNATMRSLEVARETLDREVNTGFSAPHLVRHEGRLRADIRVVSLPPGNDPDKLIREQPTLWPQLIGAAQPVVAYVIDVTTRDLDLNDPRAKAEVVQRVMPLIGDVPDPVERDHYRQLLARKLRVDERALQQVAISSKGDARPRPGNKRGATTPPPEEPEWEQDSRPARLPDTSAHTTVALSGGRISMGKREADYLAQCLRFFPHLLTQVDARLAQVGQEPIGPADFSTPEDAALWRVLSEQATQQSVATIEELCDSLDSALRQRVQVLQKVEEVSPSGRERLPDLLAMSMLNLRLERIRRQLTEVQMLLRDQSSEQDPAVLELYKQQLALLPVSIQRIHRACWALSAVNRRHADFAAR